jgi:hypothetical protein
MKYRRLTIEELQNLEQRFIQFLVANTITGADWAKLKTDEPEQASRLIDIFSEMMFETSLKKVQYLKLRTVKEMKVFRCDADKIVLMGLLADEKTPVDFTQLIDLKEIMHHTEGLSIYRTEKTFDGNREQELFKMMETGCLISDNQLFDLLEKLHGV